MRTVILLISLLLGSCGLITFGSDISEAVSGNIEFQLFEISNDNTFSKGLSYWYLNRTLTSRDQGGSLKSSLNGRSGTCLEVKNPPDGKTHFYTRTLLPVHLSSDRIIASI